MGVVLEALERHRLRLVGLLEGLALVLGQGRSLVGELLLHVAQLLGQLVAFFLLLLVQLPNPAEGLLAESRLLDEAFDVDHPIRGAAVGAVVVPWAPGGGREQAGRHRQDSIVSFQLLLRESAEV